MSRTVSAAGAAAAVFLGAAALAACGSSGPSPSGGATTSSSAPASPAAGPSGTATAPATPGGTASGSVAVAACATSHLAITVDIKQGGAAAGSVYYPIDFQNTASAACTLFGYPGVSFVTRQGGSMLGSPARRNGGSPAAQVTLPAGGYAHATVQVANAGNYSSATCRPVTAHWLRVYPPGQTAAGYAPFTTQACSAVLPANIGSQLSVYPVRPGKGQMGQAP